MKIFFSKKGKYVVCGGTTANTVSKYLNKEIVVPMDDNIDKNIPGRAEIEGIDLVTEGIITLGTVVHLLKEYIKDNSISLKIKNKNDGASLLATMLLEEATDINIFFGQAINEGNKKASIDIDFETKCKLVASLERTLLALGKQVKINRC